MKRKVHAPTGTELSCKNWLIEAAYRMIQNNLDPDVAFDPDNLIVYGGRGKAARNWECFDAILRSLKDLNEDETLLVQSGKPVGVFKSHTDAPRVLIANTNIVPHWATQEQFDQYERDGLMMYGQMTAGSWIYIGTQGILQGTYETFGSLARQHGWGTLAGKLVLTAGLGEMGGAQAQAITFNGGVGILVDVDPWRIERGSHSSRLMSRRKTLTTLCRSQKQLSTRRRQSRSLCMATPPRCIGRYSNAVSFPMLSPTRPRPTTCFTAIFLSDSISCRRPNCVRRIRLSMNGGRWTRWQSTSRRCSNISVAGRSCSITATTCGSGPRTMASLTRSTIRDLCPPTYDRCSARAKARSVGSLCRAIKKISTAPTKRS